MNWQASDLSAALKVAVTGPGANALHCDSRDIKNGDIFIALKGRNADGHQYIEDALNRGASYVLVERAVSKDPKFIVVADPYQALWDLAKYNRNRCTAEFIAITGSVGKTSLKELIFAITSKRHLSFTSPKSFNNHLGVPLTIASTPPSACYAIIEMGMNHAGELLTLTNLVQPYIAIITAIAPAHLEFFADLHSIARAKLEIMRGLRQERRIAILPRDSEFYTYLYVETQQYTQEIYTFGWHENAHSRVIDYQSLDHYGQLSLELDQQPLALKTRLVGRHQATNISAALLVSHILNISPEYTLDVLANFLPIKGRGRTLESSVHGLKLRLIDDSYNANPTSMIAALHQLTESKAKRKVAILGSMLELGASEIRYHQELAPIIISGGAGLIVTIGPLMKHLHDMLPSYLLREHYDSVEELLPRVLSLLQDGDLILLKGSAANNLACIVSYLSNA